jgi:serine/threonine protein kinase
MTTKYRITPEILGEGQYGKVHTAYHKRKKIVAKVSKPKKGKKYEQEYKLLKSLKHGNIVNVIGYEKIGPTSYIYFDYYPLTLKDFLKKYGKVYQKRNYFKEDTSLDIMKQLVDALVYLHSKHIVHLDVKLTNIMMDKYFNVKLADFGFSRVQPRGSELVGVIAGSSHYITPEMYKAFKVRTKTYCGYKSDTWAAGVCLLFLLTGTYPFLKGDEGLEHNTIHKKFVIPQKFKISPQTKSLLQKIFVKNYKNRIDIFDVQDIIS